MVRLGPNMRTTLRGEAIQIFCNGGEELCELCIPVVGLNQSQPEFRTAVCCPVLLRFQTSEHMNCNVKDIRTFSSISLPEYSVGIF